MTSRQVPPLLTTVFLLCSVLCFGVLAPVSSHAASPYDRTDRTEGDPGDGVLNPRIENGGGGGSGSNTADPRRGLYTTARYTPHGQWQWVLFVPGHGSVILVLPNSTGPGTLLNWGWHHAR